MSDLVSLTRHGDVAVITVDNPPVNALSPGVPEGIVAALDAVRADAALAAVAIRGGGQTFIAGADIKEFGRSPPERSSADPVSTSCSMRWRARPSPSSARFTARRSGAASKWRRPVTTAWRSPRPRSASRR